MTRSAIGLPPVVKGCLFDLDGVLTQTATVHMKAWKEMFDAYLAHHADGDAARPFSQEDYNDHVDGKPRADGVRDFLASRGIELPDGDPDDGPDADTVNGLGTRKNDLVQAVIARDGVEDYDGSVAYLKLVKAQGIPTAVVSASANCLQFIRATGLEQYLDHRVDGTTIASDGLRGKPAPDTFLAGARAIGVPPSAAAVFEDAVSGVQAGAAGGFGWVVGVDRVGHAAALGDGGANQVVQDLAELIP
ncbi:MAG: beta-phosphoglucomutase family hydrolase [Solirubrobacterales bacterium]|nr:beta-phosphoglucomutase family hydrolase [Solirubrobacterales bacterium]